MATEMLTHASLGGLKIVKAQERTPFLNILVYGDSGVGKTTLAGSADEVPAMRPVLMVDMEGGTESLRHSYPDVELVRVRNWEQMQILYDDLYSGKHNYKTVILDSLTEIQKFNMYSIMEELVGRKPEMDKDVPGMREWGKNLEQMRRMVRGFRDLDMHTIFTALAKEDKDDRTGVRKTLPMLSGQLGPQVSAFMDIVVYYYIKEIGSGADKEYKRLLLTSSDGKITAKDRSGKLDMVVEAPTMTSLFASIFPKQPGKLNKPDKLETVGNKS
jgi:hypothetical protein